MADYGASSSGQRPSKVDVQLSASDLLSDALKQLASLKVGGQLELRPAADGTACMCVCSSGIAVAQLPKEASWQVRGLSDVATVRSLTRDPGSGAVLTVRLRVQAGTQRQPQQTPSGASSQTPGARAPCFKSMLSNDMRRRAKLGSRKPAAWGGAILPTVPVVGSNNVVGSALVCMQLSRMPPRMTATP